MARESLASYHRLAVSTAKAAGRLLAGLSGRVRSGRMAVQYKSALNLVTEADRQAERLIVRRIRAVFPDHQIVAEEGGGGAVAQDSDAPTWFVDPLDGTTNFAHGFPFYCVSIGLEIDGRMMVGAVYDPLRKELFSAIRGKGAFCNGRRLHVSTARTLERSLLVTGFAYDLRTNRRNNFGHFYQFGLRARGLRRTGSAALDLCYVAAGRFDGFWELNLAPWDSAAGSLIVEEALGRMSNFSGGPYQVRVPELVADNGRIHDEMLGVLRLGDGMTPALEAAAKEMAHDR